MKKTTFAFATLILFALTASITSCNKEKELEPIKAPVVKLTDHTDYTISMTINGHEVMPSIVGRFKRASTVVAQLNINASSVPASQLQSSSLKPVEWGITQPMNVVKISEEVLNISFTENWEVYVGDTEKDSPPMALLQSNLLTWHPNEGEPGGWYTLNVKKLSGNYSVVQVMIQGKVSTFKLLMTDSKGNSFVITLKQK